MKKLNIELPKYRLAINFRFIKRRKPLVPEPIIPTAKIIHAKYRSGTSLGKLVRYVSDHKITRKFFAANFAALVVFSSFIPTSSSGVAAESDETLIQTEISLVTESGVQFPTESPKMTQSYSFLHPGIDLDGETGDSVRPIKTGRVISISYSKFAYGNSVLIDHGNKLSSLYAHLSQIEVEDGEEVSMDTEIGKMGETGRAFGDHLHLEIYDHGRPINPLTILR